jgi:peptidoglycan/LPS O-acetylase OafA/YrhL
MEGPGPFSLSCLDELVMKHIDATVGLREPIRFIAQLESLRGWAILLVVAFHYVGILCTNSATGLPEESGPWLKIMAAGNTGVTLFFVLSGFLLVQPFIQALKGGERVSIGRFYGARLLRILPLYYSAVLVAWVISSNGTSALKALLFVPVGFDIFPFSVPWWSLCTEVQFYVLLPWVMLGLYFRRGRYLVMAAAIAWFGLHCYMLLQSKGPGGALQSSLLGRGLAFLVGGVCAWFYLSRGFVRLVQAPRVMAICSLLLLAALLVLLHWYGSVGQKNALQILPLYHDLEALLWGGLLLASLCLSSRTMGLLINPLFSHFGTISYSLYLVHVPIQFYLIYPLKAATDGAWSPGDPWSLVVICGSFILSWLMAIACYRLIERPFLKLKSHLPVLTDKLRGRPARA